MAKRENSVKALLMRAENDIGDIETEYRASLQAKKVSVNLKIDIKNFCENLRSGLDYLANDIRETHCPTAKPDDRFYFPILPDRKQFESQTDRWFPDLAKTKPDLWNYLESVQPYHAGYEWLGLFNKVNIENKHGDLVEQTRIERDEIRVTSQDGTQVSWDPNSVKFGDGVYIAGVPVNPSTQLPVPHPSQKVEKIIWVDFQFTGIMISALQLLQQTLAETKQIAENLYQIIK
jgi:hypothetical protein